MYIRTSQHYRQRAEHFRKMAAAGAEVAIRAHLLKLAVDYDDVGSGDGNARTAPPSA